MKIEKCVMCRSVEGGLLEEILPTNILKYVINEVGDIYIQVKTGLFHKEWVKDSNIQFLYVVTVK